MLIIGFDYVDGDGWLKKPGLWNLGVDRFGEVQVDRRLGNFYAFGSEMAAGADFSPPFTVLEGGYKDNGTGLDEEKAQTFQNFKQLKGGKPPRHVLRHSISTTAFAPELEVSVITQFLVLQGFGKGFVGGLAKID